MEMEPLEEEFNLNLNLNKNVLPKKIKILIGILIGLVVILLTIVIIFIIIFSKIKIINFNDFFKWSFYGEVITNIPYANSDNIIINSFKLNGDNYNETIGNINNGKDYEKNERNGYNLFIPYSATKKKEHYNNIILFIHGGAWVGGQKETLNEFCKIYSQNGYITATVGYTLLISKYKDYNIYRQLDEITACIQSIKEQLSKKGFDINKLDMAVAGYSAGAHLALLYSYLMKNSPLSIKFAINLCGPMSLDPKFFYKNAKANVTLDSLEPEEIQKALNDKRIIRINEDDSDLLNYMNLFTGSKYSNSDMKGMLLGNKKINYDNEKYKEMYKIAQYAYPVNHINSNSVPTLCLYGGNDDVVGVTQYAYLKEKYGNNLHLIYSRYATHFFLDFDTEVGINSLRELNYQILEYAKKYFSKD